jgi:hypothetical protein
MVPRIGLMSVFVDPYETDPDAATPGGRAHGPIYENGQSSLIDGLGNI